MKEIPFKRVNVLYCVISSSISCVIELCKNSRKFANASWVCRPLRFFFSLSVFFGSFFYFVIKGLCNCLFVCLNWIQLDDESFQFLAGNSIIFNSWVWRKYIGNSRSSTVFPLIDKNHGNKIPLITNPIKASWSSFTHPFYQGNTLSILSPGEFPFLMDSRGIPWKSIRNVENSFLFPRIFFFW